MLLTDSNIYNMRHLEAVKKNLPRRSKEIPTTASVVAYDIKNFKTCFRCNMHVLENFPFSNRWIIHQISINHEFTKYLRQNNVIIINGNY